MTGTLDDEIFLQISKASVAFGKLGILCVLRSKSIMHEYCHLFSIDVELIRHKENIFSVLKASISNA